MNSKNKICIVVATPMTAHVFLKDQILGLSNDFEVTVAANFSENPGYMINWDKVRTVDIPIARPIKPAKDLKALFKLFLFFRKNRFYAVHSITPKAGLLCMIAGFLARIPIRIHTFTGQVWVTRKGIVRRLLKNIDRFFASFATHVYTDSPSQLDFLVENKVISFDKIKVLGDGSISGVDLKRFQPDFLCRQQIRDSFGFTEECVVILFLGRMNPDKGIVDLVRAFKKINNNNVHLLMVGPDDGCTHAQLLEIAGPCSSRIHFRDYTSEPEKIMGAADIFCLPSYREGFGSVVIEAAACGIPSVASKIYGLTDAVVDGSTGLLFPPGDVDGLVFALQKLVENFVLRKQMGDAARIRAVDLFSQERLTGAMLAEYLTLTGYSYHSD
ncbi:MAG: glycosyltransferase family 4 protein [Desulfobacteraceae bacterium]|nr:glycosyltransferase family 4 protein [Desulfobacteraceae bacterium]